MKKDDFRHLLIIAGLLLCISGWIFYLFFNLTILATIFFSTSILQFITAFLLMLKGRRF